MPLIAEGKAWVYPANVTTEDILPNAFLDRANDQVGQFAMAGIHPEFAEMVQVGDFVVGGDNFGCGSSRETAAIALKLAGVGAVVAPSFGRVFFRNCINVGLPAVVIETIEGIQAGDRLTLDLDAHILTNTRTGQKSMVLNLTGITKEILSAGGIVPFTKQRMER